MTDALNTSQAKGAANAVPASATNLPVAPRSAGVNWSGSPADVAARPPHFGRTEDGGLCIVLACAMMEDEVRAAYEAAGCDMEIRWVDRGYHENPDTLRAKLQEMIAQAQDDGATWILLAIGLCGNGVVGLVAEHARLVMPRFDDCINIMLCTGERDCRGKAQAGIMYLTRGWAHDATMVTGQREFYARKYGERRADRLMKAMFGAYTGVSLIDNGCYDLEGIDEYAQACARALDVDIRVDEGSNAIMEKLMSGQWDSDILVCEPGRAIMQEDFDDWQCASCSNSPEHEEL